MSFGPILLSSVWCSTDKSRRIRSPSGVSRTSTSRRFVRTRFPHDPSSLHQAIDQIHGAVMLDLQTSSEFADRRDLSFGQAFDRQQKLVLLRLDVVGPRRVRATGRCKCIRLRSAQSAKLCSTIPQARGSLKRSASTIAAEETIR